jgi:UDP-glucose:(heptosyl)LPS alpha-1,3-glucosyltransferase
LAVLALDQRMKIAVFNRHFSRRAGGAESYSVALVEGLAEQHEVHVFAQTIEHSHPRVTYHKVPGPVARPRWINQLFFAAYTWWKTRKPSNEWGFDVIHSHENTWHGQVQTVHVRPIRYNLFHPNHKALSGWRLWLRWLKVCTSPRLASYVWLEAARMCQPFVVAVSGEMQRQTLTAYPHLAKQNVPIILPGVGAPDLSLTTQEARTRLNLPTSSDLKLVLFVGNDYARKGLPALLAAMPALQPNIHVACVGSPQMIPKFQLMAAELGITERVHFVGALADMSIAYRAADMLAHPTLEDSFAMVVLEAMSYGLPVVVSSAKYCGISQFLQGGIDALLLEDPHDIVSLGAAIKQIFSDANLSQALSTEGLRFAAQHQWHSAVDRYSQLYAEITLQSHQRLC